MRWNWEQCLEEQEHESAMQFLNAYINFSITVRLKSTTAFFFLSWGQGGLNLFLTYIKDNLPVVFVEWV